MRTFSTPQSALDGEITKLAIVECVLAVALYVGISIYLGTFKYLALAVVVAPLMLFRTKMSAERGVKVYGKFLDRIGYLVLSAGRFRKPIPNLLTAILVWVVHPLGGTVIRIITTVYWSIKRPLYTLKEVPQNWLRQSFCTDSVHPPEIVPLENIEGLFSFIDACSIFSDEKGLRSVKFFILTLPTLLAYIPPTLYRLSFKATTLAYIPFIWVAHVTLRNPLPVKARLERITKGELEKVARWISGIILTCFVAKGALIFNWVDRGYLLSKFPSEKILTNIVILDGWPWWQPTLGTAAALTFLLLWFSDAAPARLDNGMWGEDFVLKTVSMTSFIRATLGIITMYHFFHIALVSIAPTCAVHLLP